MMGVTDPVLLSVRGLRKSFPLPLSLGDRLRGVRRPQVLALDEVDIDAPTGATIAVVGESGSGKSTLGRCILRLIEPDGGTVLFDGHAIVSATPDEMRALRRRMQIVFQDPYSSLNPRMTVSRILGEVLMFHAVVGSRRERAERVVELLGEVGLDAAHAARYPHEFSGGQRQRIGIARALAVRPDFVVLDEPVASLDVSVQAQIVNLLEELQHEHGLTYLFIAHDLSVVHHISDRVAVMYLGRIVEEAATDELFAHPHHPYTRALLAAIPRVDPTQRSRHIIAGEISTVFVQEGCPFRPRCRYAMPVCDTIPPWVEVARSHFSRCWLDAGPRYGGSPEVTSSRHDSATIREFDVSLPRT